MKKYSESTYGDQIADVYDDWYTDLDQAIIPTLVELVQGGRALELGIGTGRVALPLHQAGVEVHGIDASQAMVEKLQAKPGSELIPVSIGNFADVAVEGQFDLIYVVFNTFFALSSQEEQILCMQNAATKLTPNGIFLMEVFFPNMARYVDQQTVRATAIDDRLVQLEATRIDMINQQIVSQHTVLSDEGIRLYPVKIRYAWPAELDLMARLAGLTLQHRWGTWRKDPFTQENGRHISVYILAD
ncbi:MAG: class I SAM-dependent DNA methyltransferase [Anaerolineales bacterium]